MHRNGHVSYFSSFPDPVTWISRQVKSPNMIAIGKIINSPELCGTFWYFVVFVGSFFLIIFGTFSQLVKSPNMIAIGKMVNSPEFHGTVWYFVVLVVIAINKSLILVRQI